MWAGSRQRSGGAHQAYAVPCYGVPRPCYGVPRPVSRLACQPAARSSFGEVERYEDSYRLCYVRGPEGIIVELAEQIG